MVRPLGRPGEPSGAMNVVAVAPSYFDTLRMRLVRGRLFTSADTAGMRKVGVIDDQLAKRLWPTEDPVGRCEFGSSASTSCTEIVGVVESRRGSVGSSRFSADLFVPLAQTEAEQVPQVIIVRSRQTPAASRAVLARAIHGVVPNLPYASVRPFDEIADSQTRSWRLGRTLFGLFGSVAVLLSALGVFGVLALAARQRTTEIGVRMALGARPVDIARLVLRHAAAITLGGWGAGLVLAYFGGRAIATLLFQVSPMDGMTFAVASLVALLAGLAGCAVPAIRAASIMPIVALRRND
jgi:ABC-type antimicrobial peptide transport system permease subunit